MKVIIAEKTSVADEYAKVLGVQKTSGKGFYEGNDWIVTWARGHLVTLSYPEKYNEELKAWKLDNLPFLPDTYRYEVIWDCAKQFSVVKSLYNRKDVNAIYYAGDSGREGLYIQMLIRQMAGHNPGAEERVVWIDSQTEEEILRGISEAKPLSAYKNLSDAAYMRAICDYSIGINYTRLLSILFSAMLNSGSGNRKMIPVTVGRVMSCVLGMIVRREREIRTFRVTPFYRIIGSVHLGESSVPCEWKVSEQSSMYQSPKLYSEFGFLKEPDAKEFADGLDKHLTVLSVERIKEKKFAPLLFNLAELQGECTKVLHISPARTLEIVQSLYEKKVTTYPRTDARVLSSAVAKEITTNLNGLKNSEYSEIVSEIIPDAGKAFVSGKYVDDSKITDHYAIIPTGRKAELSGDEKTVYDMIVRRFLSIFFPPAVYEKVSFSASSGKEMFYGSCKVLVEKGFYDVAGVPNDVSDDNEAVIDQIANLVKGQTYDADFSLKNGSTAPPKRYTSGSMILAMENAGSLIEDEELREQIKSSGIGTSATRAEVIEKLCRLKYVSLDDKKQILTPTRFGEMIYEVLDIALPDFLSPELTADWEKTLSGIADGTIRKTDFEKDFFDSVRNTTDKIKQNADSLRGEVKNHIYHLATSAIRDEIKPFESYDTKLKCPLCGKDIVTTAWGFKCSGNIKKGEGCPFSIGDVFGHRLLTKELAELLHKGKAGPFYDFVSAKGKPFAAFLLWNDTDKKIGFEFTDMPWVDTDYNCPFCGKKVKKQGNYYKCEGYIDRDHGCKFFIGKVAGKTITEKNVEQLCKEGRTELIKGFKAKSGNKFDAFLSADKMKKSIVLKFPGTEDIATDMRCPVCGGRILNTPYGFKCENYVSPDKRKGDPSECTFYPGTIMEHLIKEKELKEILSGGVTEPVSLKNKDKKEFSARLYFNREEGRIGLQFDDNAPEEIGCSCPICGGKVLKNKYGYFCSNRKGRNEGCQFFLGSIAGVMLDTDQAVSLIRTGKSDLISGFKPKDKKTKKAFSAYLVWNADEKKYMFSFPDKNEARERSDYNCPFCGKKLYSGMSSFYCDCGFKVPKVVSGVQIPDEQMKKLLIRGQTDMMSGFFSPKKRSLFSAKLRLNRESKKVEFEFPERKEKSEGVEENEG